MSTITTIKGPRGWRIELDTAQIVRDNPGEGTPAMIYGPGNISGTWFCYEGSGDVDGEEPSDPVRAWLNDPSGT